MRTRLFAEAGRRELEELGKRGECSLSISLYHIVLGGVSQALDAVMGLPDIAVEFFSVCLFAFCSSLLHRSTVLIT